MKNDQVDMPSLPNDVPKVLNNIEVVDKQNDVENDKKSE